MESIEEFGVFGEFSPNGVDIEQIGVTHGTDGGVPSPVPVSMDSFEFNPVTADAEVWYAFSRSAVWHEIKRYIASRQETATNGCRKGEGIPLYRDQGRSDELQRFAQLVEMALEQTQKDK